MRTPWTTLLTLLAVAAFGAYGEDTAGPAPEVLGNGSLDANAALVAGATGGGNWEAFCASPALPPAIFLTPLTSGNVQVSG